MRPGMLASPAVLLAALLALSACDKLVDGSNAAASVTGQAFSDATSTWVDLFTYHPPVPAPLPQTRYCYKMLTDIVCYDSVQPKLTAKLFGYQDGDQISWIQPGGGSLGASGGDPIALQPFAAHRTTSRPRIIEAHPPIETTPAEEVKMGEIQSVTLAPR